MISSFDDLRSSMGCMNPENEEQRQRIIRYLKKELDYENSYKYRRSTVVKMLESKIRALQKIKL